MGRYLFHLPDVGEGVAEAEVVAWHVNVGDRVAEDQNLADVMTDKATVEITSPVEGVVTAINGEVGGMLAVGAVLVEFDVEGADHGEVAADPPSSPVPPPLATVSPVRDAPSGGQQLRISSPVAERSSAPLPPRPVAPGRPADEAPLAAPATRRRAHALGVPLQFVSGTGPGGRITPDDLDAWLASGGADAAPARRAPRTSIRDTRIVGMRRRIAEKMQESKRRIPHLTYVEECDLTELEALRLDLNAHRTGDQPKLTLLPFILCVLARVLPEFPQINAHYDDDAGLLHEHDGVHIGVATQTPAGLMVPVLRHVETLDLWDCAREIARLSQAARDATVTRDELSGSTITVTSMGPLGGVVSTPVINHPEVAIINPNRLVERPVIQGSFVTMRRMMNLSSAYDHRIVDGYDAARFVQRIKRMLEHPALIFMD